MIPKFKTDPGGNPAFGPSPWKLMGMGLELGAIIGGLTFLGHLADRKLGTHPWLAFAGAMLATAGGTYNLAKEVLKKPRPASRPPAAGPAAAPDDPPT